MKHSSQKLDWDTSFFGIESFKVMIEEKLESEDFEEIISQANNRAPCFIQICTPQISFLEKIKIDSSNFKFMEENYFYEKKITPCKESISLEKATREDIPQLIDLVKDSFNISRFYKDKNISPILSSQLYIKWIENSVLGSFDDYCLISKSGKEITAFSSIKELPSNEYRIGLLGINKKHRGSGLSYQLISAIEHYLKSGTLKVSTQKENLAANKVYTNSNFSKVSTQAFYHGWFKKDEK